MKPVLMDKLCDILFISEPKLGETFSDNMFITKGYKMERKDRNARGRPYGLLQGRSTGPENKEL